MLLNLSLPLNLLLKLNMKKIVLLFLVFILFSSCEKDDICDASTATTPQIVIEFYDLSPVPVLKNVVNLLIPSEGTSPSIEVKNTSKLKLPLKTNEDTTIFAFVQNGLTEPTTDDNIDYLVFNYKRNTVFVSRACGFKSTFALTSPILKIDKPIPDGFWIQNIEIVQPTIDNENEVHVKIKF